MSQDKPHKENYQTDYRCESQRPVWRVTTGSEALIRKAGQAELVRLTYLASTKRSEVFGEAVGTDEQARFAIPLTVDCN